MKWKLLGQSPHIEIHNFEIEEDFKKNNLKTTKNMELLKCFENFVDFNSAWNNWLSVFKDIIKKSFKKISKLKVN